MEKTLTREAKIQLASSLRRRYQTASSRAKKQILGEFVAVSGYHPKYAIHLLNAAEPSASERRGRVRPTLYDEAAKQALIGKRVAELSITHIFGPEDEAQLNIR